MEVPFISSGALSRAHYVLVRKVELAKSTQQADNYLLEEVDALRDRLSRPGFTSVGPAPFPAREALLNVPDRLGTMSRVPHHLAVLFHEYHSWTSSWRAGIRTPACRESGRGWFLHRG
jgi:hypothetical protein